MRLHLETAGESHGPGLIAILSGLPAGLRIDPTIVDRDLARRQHGHGRGGRMDIEKDRGEISTGLIGGVTLGSPIAIRIENRDHAHWLGVTSPFTVDEAAAAKRRLAAPRPGHADLAGSRKFETHELRRVLERSSARETASRVAAGALARQLLAEFGIEIRSGVRSIGAVGPEPCVEMTVRFADLPTVDDGSPLRLIDRSLEADAVALVDATFRAGDTLGGTIVVGAAGLPVGLGSSFHWHSKLDGRLGQALLSIPAVKAVSIGDGLAQARRSGSEVHDPIEYDGAYRRPSNRAGGLEGGITNGEELLAAVFMKPISTLRRGLPSVNIDTKEPTISSYERSDVTAVPACGVVAEAMMALVLADALLEKFGGDSLAEVRRNFEAFRAQDAAW